MITKYSIIIDKLYLLIGYVNILEGIEKNRPLKIDETEFFKHLIEMTQKETNILFNQGN